jgi:hypothetical protein
MFVSETTALLRAILEEVCHNVDRSQNATRAHVAAGILAAAGRGRITAEDVREAGREALKTAPTTWR